MNDYFAVLIDTVSIQQYIFQSNKLKENLGASYLVSKIYLEPLCKIVSQLFNEELDFDAWEKEPAKIREPFDVGYIGGGNALLLFKDQTKAQTFVKEWTKLLLMETPGIITAVAIKKIAMDNYLISKKKLFDLLKINKSTFVPQTIIPRQGITAECSRTGLSLDVFNEIVGEFVSSSANARIMAARKAQEEINDHYRDILGNQFCFSGELEKLGQVAREDSHIAIAHIDGNNMGDRFKAMDTLEKSRRLSKTVDEATRNAFRELLKYIVVNYAKIMESLGFDNSSDNLRRRFPVDDERKKLILPIRPIILGGDDIIFVSDGKLGIFFSKIFIENFEKQTVSDRQKLTACAGVAVIKTKYPFYRGVILAEELCHNAKTERRNSEDTCSYIDFHISTGGITGSLEEIREKNFKVNQGELDYRPYKFVPQDKDERSFELFLSKTRELKQFPKNKISQLRTTLTLSEEATKQFAMEMKFRGRTLPTIPGHTFHHTLFEDGKTPYFDMIELLELYPSFELETNGKDEDENI